LLFFQIQIYFIIKSPTRRGVKYMRRFVIIISLVASGAMILAGCETVPKKVKKDIAGLTGRVDTLESRVENVEGKQTELETAVTSAARAAAAAGHTESKAKVRTSRINVSPKRMSSPRTREEMREIQICLKNANFYQGEIDGIKGRATRRAIREFQKANALRADGVVGPKTRELLSKYMSPGAASKVEKDTIK
jgi:outer membrane murein-binding lipoprotein Lpp